MNRFESDASRAGEAVEYCSEDDEDYSEEDGDSDDTGNKGSYWDETDQHHSLSRNHDRGRNRSRNASHEHSHEHHLHPYLTSFAPPFYNRPPTPLPPSPSLTSLLRPSFSTSNSRPTTPDSSEVDVDADTNNDTEAVVAKSARIATTVPRASPKVPTYEYYGFVLYLASGLAFLIYLLWSFLPSPFLHQLGIYYYPNRWWSLAIPSYLVISILYVYIALAAYNTGYLTLPMNSIENLVDDAANIAVIDSKGRRRPGGSEKVKPNSITSITMGGMGYQPTSMSSGSRRNVDWESIWSYGTDAVMDIPIGGVCEVLYAKSSSGVDAEETEEIMEDVVCR